MPKRRMCRKCGKHRAIFWLGRLGHRRKVAADKDHDLCIACWRAALNKEYSTELREAYQSDSARDKLESLKLYS
jgi:hypothetical protein